MKVSGYFAFYPPVSSNCSGGRVELMVVSYIFDYYDGEANPARC